MSPKNQILSVKRLPRLPSWEMRDLPTPSGRNLEGRVGVGGASMGMVGGPERCGASTPAPGPELVVTGDLAGLGLMMAMASELAPREKL